jgi:hypothetical protein
VIPDKDVDAPMNNAPISASPKPVVWARSRAVLVILTPNHPMIAAAARKEATMNVNGQLAGSIKCVLLNTIKILTIF